MLVVLSEIHCLDKLNSLGVYPDEYYTDFDSFKIRSAYFMNAEVLIILGGNFRFNKRAVALLVASLRNRRYDSNDGSIKKIWVMTDQHIQGISHYYLYKGVFDGITEYRGWKKTTDQHNPLAESASEPKLAREFLSAYDEGNADALVKQYTDIASDTTKDMEYEQHIKVWHSNNA